MPDTLSAEAVRRAIKEQEPYWVCPKYTVPDAFIERVITRAREIDAEMRGEEKKDARSTEDAS